jgi:hypothetical protein
VAGLRAVRPAGFMTKIAPKVGEADAPATWDFGRHQPAIGDFVPLEYFCQRSRILPAWQTEWTKRSIPRVLPGLPFEKVAGIEDLLAEKGAAKPFFANAPKIENRRWGGRYLEFAAAAVVLATVLATGLHIATHVGTEAPKVQRDLTAVRVNAAPAPMKPASGPLAQIRPGGRGDRRRFSRRHGGVGTRNP